MISVGTDIASSRAAVEYARSEKMVLAAAGVHPHDAVKLDDSTMSELSDIAVQNTVVAIGETGLDYFRDRSPRVEQQRAFIDQIQLAADTGKPLIVHSRDARDDTLKILHEQARGLVVILHCFSLVDDVAACAREGYFMSVAGNVTYKNARKLREAAAAIPAELLLTETDAPFLTPVPHRGEANQPAYINHVLSMLAEIHQAEEYRLAEQIADNFRRVFSVA